MSWVPPDRPPADGPAPGGPPPQRPPSGPAGPPSWSPQPGPPFGPQPWQPAGPPRRRKPATIALLVAVAVLLVTGIGTASVLLGRADDRSGAGATSSAERSTEGPSETDEPPATTTTTVPDEAPAPPASEAELEATVAELSQYVAGVRGAPFPGPVQVELLDVDAFNQRLLDDFEEEREEIDLVGRLFVAMQLLDPDEDLFEIFHDFLGAGVLGFYDPETGELVVRGAAITPYTRSTIVHELTHAYDDQRFELDRPALRDASDESGLGFSALVEGNATRVQRLWEAELSVEERDELVSEQIASVTGVDFGAVPFVLLHQIEFPYTSGSVLVEALAEAGGEARIDAAFAAPPTTSEQVIDPDRYLAGERPLPLPAPRADGEVIDQGTYGQLTLSITLGDVIDRETARQAADGWGGDAYVAWADGDRTCVRVAFRMDTPEDLVELVDAWQTWTEGHPDATVAPARGIVTVTACG